jgi:hypothetical protein
MQNARNKVARFVASVEARNAVTIDGDTITKTWRGMQHVVRVVDGGYEYLGVTYRSATAAARAITNTKAINGRAFFNLDSKRGAA